MNEQERLKELKAYKILDTSPEKELEDLAEIASAICDTPISLVSLVDEDRQWFKVRQGIERIETPRTDSFCQHALQNPREVLVIEDSWNDERFKNNNLVTGDPKIRFYAGAPLQTQNGHVLGTLCIIDTKPRSITESQKKALILLAEKAMNYLETRKMLLEQQDHLKLIEEKHQKMTDQAPGVVYEFEMKPDGTISFPFMSDGLASLNPQLDVAEVKINPRTAYTIIHPDDLEEVKQSLRDSYTNLTEWSIEYRVIAKDGSISWHTSLAKPERKEDGTVVWYGTFQDITDKKDYISTLEQILFDISHVMRRPVANMLGLAAAINTKTLDNDMMRTLSEHMQKVSEEMDTFIKQLNNTYSDKRSKLVSPVGEDL